MGLRTKVFVTGAVPVTNTSASLQYHPGASTSSHIPGSVLGPPGAPIAPTSRNAPTPRPFTRSVARTKTEGAGSRALKPPHAQNVSHSGTYRFALPRRAFRIAQPVEAFQATRMARPHPAGGGLTF